MKKQELPPLESRLYPIPSIDMDAEFAMLGTFDDENITHLKTDYLKLPEDNPAHFLIALHAREYLADTPTLRRPYRAGVIAGSIILRSRIYAIGEEPRSFLADAPHERVDWPEMQLSRFALRQYFAADVDVKQHLYETVETPWFLHGSYYATYGEHPANDWMAIGMGDMLRVGDEAEARAQATAPRPPITAPVAPEPLLAPRFPRQTT